MTSSLDKKDRADSENESGCHPRADVITGQTIHGDTIYLIRLREDWDTVQNFHLKKLSEIRTLDEKLREADKTADAETKLLKVIPALPKEGAIGFRRQLSKLGIGNFLDRQHEGIQNYFKTLMDQVPNLAVDANLQAFFSGEREPELEEKMPNLIVEARVGINLKTLAGNWRPQGFEHTWTIEESGKALLDGQHRGANYDLAEQGEGLAMTIARPDGWKVDIERSTTSHLFWNMQGQADLEWIRGEGFEDSSPGRRPSGAPVAAAAAAGSESPKSAAAPESPKDKSPAPAAAAAEGEGESSPK